MPLQRRRELIYCEMCGMPIEGRSYTIVVETTEMVVCERCYRRYMSRATRTGTDEPLRLRIAPRRERPEPARPATPPTPRHTEPRPAAGPSARQQPRRPPRRRGTGLGAIERYEVVEDYAERVRRARERLGLTQKELAVKVKVGENVIKRIEAGTLVPPIDLAMRLERVLGVKLLEPVVEEEEEPLASGRKSEFYLTLGDIAELRED